MSASFGSLDPNQYWKFFVDYKYWNEGERKFDNEDSPGYLQHANHALAWMLKTYNEKHPVDLDYIITLRNMAFHLDNDLPPSTIEDPGWFTGWSVEELTTKVIDGQKRFQSLCHPLKKRKLRILILLRKRMEGSAVSTKTN